MSKDIRSFFKSKSSISHKDASREVITDSSKYAGKRRRIIESDEENESCSTKEKIIKKSSTELASVDVSSVFSSIPIKSQPNIERISNSTVEAINQEKNSPNDDFIVKSSTNQNPELKCSLKKNTDLTDEEKYERKRASAILYQKYKNREGPTKPGSKKIPQGKENCLAGFTFLITGVLESLEREVAEDLIKKYGGKIVKSISKKVEYLVVGYDAGPAKITKAQELGIKQISEDDLFDLILIKSGIKNENEAISMKPQNDEKKIGSLNINANVTKATCSLNMDVKNESNFDMQPTSKAGEVKSNFGPTFSKHVSFVDKYKPKSSKQLIGQQEKSSNYNKLCSWISNWHKSREKKNLNKPSVWNKNDDGAYFTAALLSGPPGVGKTTCVEIACHELGYDFVEFNASDTRSKKLLNDAVVPVLKNQSLSGYAKGDTFTTSKKQILVMDEVDGMAGNEDRGGISELITFIKNTKIPIICMCNDRNNQKIRSLANYCFDLRFSKPKLEQIRGAMMSICYKEGLKLPLKKIEEIVLSTDCDIRQTLNYIAMQSAQIKESTINDFQKSINISKKDIKMSQWDVIRKNFDYKEQLSVNEKTNLFFHDYSLCPIFTQENYLGVTPKASQNTHSNLYAMAADSLSMGDLVDRRIRSANAWSLLPTQAIFSFVIPGSYLNGSFTKQINFPAWLGKNSKASKRKRLAQEIHDHCRFSTAGSRSAVRLDYAPFILKSIVHPLKMKELKGVEESLETIKYYRLLREDLESLVELTTWPKQKSILEGVDKKVKAALTRLYNKEMLYSYSVSAQFTKKQTKFRDTEDINEEDNLESDPDMENDEEDKLENNPFVKIKKTNKGIHNTFKKSKATATAGKTRK